MKSSNNERILLSSNYVMGTTRVSRIEDSVSIIPEKIGRRGISNPTLSYFSSAFASPGIDSASYRKHEYDLYEYARIIDTEAIVYKAFERKKTLMFKSGYEFRSNSDENVRYIKQRLKEFKFVSGVSFEQFLEELAYNLIMFHNAYAIVYRSERHSTEDKRDAGHKMLAPIAALFNIPTESVERIVEPNGEISKYKQSVGYGKWKIFNKDIVKHLSYNKRSGFTMGTPPLEPVRDDILALRRIEESVETLIYKSLFPIIHVKVGTPDRPAQVLRNGQSEVSVMNQVLKEIDDYGGVVTSERVEIKSIGAESLALRVESYLNHFKERVMIGLGVSAPDLGIGDSSGRTTGSIISQNLKEAVADMQRVISRFVTEEIFSELLVESGKYKARYLIPDDEEVALVFGDIDKESSIKAESHLLNLMNSGAITVQELRGKIGMRPLTEQEMRSMGEWAENITPPTQVEQARASVAAATSGSLSRSSNNISKSAGAKNLAASIVEPTNQFTDSLFDKDKDIINILSLIGDRIAVRDYLVSMIDNIVDIDNISDNLYIKDMCDSTSDRLHILGNNKYDAVEEIVYELIITVGEECTQ